MRDILARLADSSATESSHELQCRCFDAAEEISRLRSVLSEMLADLPSFECSDFHHAKKDQNHGQDCPVFDRFTSAVERARTITKP